MFAGSLMPGPTLCVYVFDACTSKMRAKVTLKLKLSYLSSIIYTSTPHLIVRMVRLYKQEDTKLYYLC